MALRKIVRIDEALCDGCGQCVPACAEGALQIVDGKAKLMGEILCDGLGACLGECPQGAISIEQREAAEFDEAAVKEHLATLEGEEELDSPKPAQPDLPCGCPGSAVRTLRPGSIKTASVRPIEASSLSHWPVQLMLVPPSAPFLRNADLLICADCVPFTVPDFHSRYLEGRSVLVGCPKLDDLEFYREKLKDIFATARPARVTVLRMEVPCCGGIAHAAIEARDAVAPDLPLEVHTLGIRGGSQRQVVAPRAKAAQGGSS